MASAALRVDLIREAEIGADRLVGGGGASGEHGRRERVVVGSLLALLPISTLSLKTQKLVRCPSVADEWRYEYMY